MGSHRVGHDWGDLAAAAAAAAAYTSYVPGARLGAEFTCVDKTYKVPILTEII